MRLAPTGISSDSQGQKEIRCFVNEEVRVARCGVKARVRCKIGLGRIVGVEEPAGNKQILQRHAACDLFCGGVGDLEGERFRCGIQSPDGVGAVGQPFHGEEQILSVVGEDSWNWAIREDVLPFAVVEQSVILYGLQIVELSWLYCQLVVVFCDRR